MDENLTKLMNKALGEAMETQFPQLLESIRTLKTAGISKENILTLCRDSGAKGMILLAIEAELDLEEN